MRLYDEFLTWLFITALVASVAFAKLANAETPCAELLPKCQSALSACDDLTKAQDAQVIVLRDSVKQWKKQAQGPTLEVPLVVWTALAGAVGGGVGGQVAGGSLAGGAAVGAAVGLLIGILGR